MDGEDRIGAVLGRSLDREAAVRLERGPDPLGPLGDLVRGDHGAEDGLGHDVVGEMGRAVDDAHSSRSSSRRSGPPARSRKPSDRGSRPSPRPAGSGAGCDRAPRRRPPRRPRRHLRADPGDLLVARRGPPDGDDPGGRRAAAPPPAGSANIERTDASSACGRVEGTSRPAGVSTTAARAARSWSASQLAGSHDRRSARYAVIDVITSGGSSSPRRNSSTSMSVAVSISTSPPSTSTRRAQADPEPGRGHRRDDRPEPVPGQDDRCRRRARPIPPRRRSTSPARTSRS